MLPATLKLCCGISHQHLRKLTACIHINHYKSDTAEYIKHAWSRDVCQHHGEELEHLSMQLTLLYDDPVEYPIWRSLYTCLQRPAVGAFGKEMSTFILKSLSGLPNIPPSLEKMICTKLGTNTVPNVRETAKLSSEELFYFTQAEDTLHKAMCMLQQDGWQEESQEENGDCIRSKTFPRLGKVCRAEAVIDSPPEHICRQLFEEYEQMDQWNPNINKAQILQRIGRNTVLTRETTAPIPISMVSQRDFVSVRHCYRKGSSLYLIGTATDSKLGPPQEGVVRAEVGLTCIVLQPIDGDSGKTKFTWLLNFNLKGWIPQPMADQKLALLQVDFIQHLRKHLSSRENIC